MKKWFKIFLALGVLVCLLLAMALFVVTRPSVQKSLILGALGDAYGEVTIEDVRLGTGLVRLAGVRIRNEDFTLQWDEAEVVYSVWDLMMGNDIELGELLLSGWRLDVSGVTDFAALQEKYFGKSEEKPFAGVLLGLRDVPVVKLGQVDLTGEVLLPLGQAVRWQVRDVAAKEGELESVFLLDGIEGLSRAKAQVSWQQFSDGGVSGLSLALEAKGELGEDLGFVQMQLQAKQEGESYEGSVSVAQASPALVTFAGEFLPAKDRVEGRFAVKVGADDWQGLPVTSPWLPGSVQASGDFVLGTQRHKPEFSVDMQAEVLSQGVAGSAWQAWQPLQLSSVLRAKMEGDAVSVEQAAVRIKDAKRGEEVAAVEVVEALRIEQKAGTWQPNRSGDLLRVSFADLPLLWFSAWWADAPLQVEAGVLQGSARLGYEASQGFSWQTDPRLTIDGLSLAQGDGRSLLRDVQVALATAGSWQGQADPLLDSLQLSVLPKVKGSDDAAELSLSLRKPVALSANWVALPDGELAGIRAQGFPLAVFASLVEGVSVEGTVQAMNFALMKQGAALRLQSLGRQELSLDSLRLGETEDVLRQLDVAWEGMTLSWDGALGGQLSLEDYHVWQRQADVLRGNVSAQVSMSLLSKSWQLSSDGALSTNLSLLQKQPVAQAWLPRGTMGVLDVGWDVTKAENWSGTATVAGKRLRLRAGGGQSVSMDAFSIDGVLQQSGSEYQLSAPLMVRAAGAQTDVSLSAKADVEAQRVRLLLKGDRLVVDHVMALAALASGEDAEAAPVEQEASATDEVDLFAWTGVVDVQLAGLDYLDKGLRTGPFDSRLEMTDSQWTHDLQVADLFEGSLEWEAQLTKSQRATEGAKPYALAGEMAFADVDGERLFTMGDARGTALFTGDLSGKGSFQSQASGLGALLDDLLWEAQLQGKSGDLRLFVSLLEKLKLGPLAKLIGPASALGGLLGEALGTKNPDIAGVLQLAGMLSSLSYDEMDLQLSRKELEGDIETLWRVSGIDYQLQAEGAIAYLADKALVDSPMLLQMDMGVQNRLADLFGKLNLLGEEEVQGYFSLRKPIRLEGTPKRVVYDSFVSLLSKAALSLGLDFNGGGSSEEAEPSQGNTPEALINDALRSIFQ